MGGRKEVGGDEVAMGGVRSAAVMMLALEVFDPLGL